MPVVVAINRFASDSDAEIEFLRHECEKLGAKYSLSEVFAKGSEGGIDLAEKVVATIEEGKADFKVLYPSDISFKEKIESIAKNIYGADNVIIEASAKRELDNITKLGYGDLPVCMAKTQYSLSDNPTLLGRPKGFDITVKSVRLALGAGFVVCLTGDVLVMPGLPKVPAAENIDVDEKGKITGLF